MPQASARSDLDAVVVGAGPNGLAAAVTLARAGLRVIVFEASDEIGGGTATRELTLPGFRHDVCSAVHPLAFESRFFREFGLRERIPFVLPEVSYAHPLDGGRAGIAYRDLARTAEALGRDGRSYEALMRPLVQRAGRVAAFTGSPLVRIPDDPVTAALFALRSAEQGSFLWNTRFTEDVAPAMLTGVSAHAILPLPSIPAAGAGLALTAYAHGRGWPIPLGGSQSIADALADDLRAHGGEIVTGTRIRDLDELPRARATLLDVTPHALVRMAGKGLPDRYRRALTRFRYGNAAAKVDFALSAPVPWSDPRVGEAAAVHVGGSRAELAAGEREVARGRMPDSPYVLASQPTTWDPGRAPEGAHTLWTYTHVPAGSDVDRADAVIAQIERFAPGFRDTILAVSSRTAMDLDQHNPNYPLGDIAAGAPDLWQLARRPILSPRPWRTPVAGLYLSSASTAPGPGVHGLAGWYAALTALEERFGTRIRPDLSPHA
ncbi:NAD(P)/FAD-dependent oxidoreductase [Microbacterium sp. SLBN-146]|uniref:phytoene desaturase family protein n=1 Tax=Microbacterium sp. SLBN-146 TaxID=2768457 RepID=UPI001150B11F|nr:NAD(P)/FAD-dependent oxidoreductase [Microbacterium sp. SLBN-146]TQJ30782.1 phytoene dehydrogenase-like protein [Microbacterium sp. SLBN-146]